VSTQKAIPAPIGGWDAQSPLAEMPEDHAVILDNFIPRAGFIEVRRGYRRWQELPLPTQTIMAYRAANAKLFAVAGDSIYDVTSDQGALTPVYTGVASPRWQWINYANDAGTFILAANGAQAPIYYDGSIWQNSIITGTSGAITLDPTTLIDVMEHKARPFFVQKDSLRVWYLAPNAIQGTANLLDLGPVFEKGGTILCQATWTVDGGAGADDLAIWVTTEGQVAVYQGIDPSDANDWALVGIYDVGFPLSRRSLIKYGSDLVLVTSDGVIPLSQALQLDRAQGNLVALTQKVQNAFQQSTQRYRNNFGWEGTLYPKGSLAIFNIPTVEGTRSEQYVQNIQTGAWCRFTGLNATTWCVWEDSIYFGSTGGIYLWDEGYSDDDLDITADLKTAFNYFGSRGSLKKFQMLQPVINLGEGVEPAIEVLTDFQERIPTATPTVIRITGSLWDGSLWDVAEWGSGAETRSSWTTVTGIGYCGSVRIRLTVSPRVVALGTGDGTDLVSSDGTDYIVVFLAPETRRPLEIIAFNVKYENQIGGQL
jgi:hypothetical protein